jgi:hypothetical protein
MSASPSLDRAHDECDCLEDGPENGIDGRHGPTSTPTPRAAAMNCRILS